MKRYKMQQINSTLIVPLRTCSVLHNRFHISSVCSHVERLLKVARLAIVKELYCISGQ